MKPSRQGPLRKVVGTEPNWVQTSNGYARAGQVKVLACGHRQAPKRDPHSPTNAAYRHCHQCAQGKARWPINLNVADIRQIERVVVFIDGSNLYFNMRDLFGAHRYAPDRLARLLVGPTRELVEWRFYIARLDEGETDAEHAAYEAQQRFFHALNRKEHAVLCFGRVVVNGGGHKKEKGTDVKLAIDLVQLAGDNRYDVAIVVSGDEDLVAAADLVQTRHGKIVEAAVLDGQRAFHMIQIAKQIQRITPEMFDQVRLDKDQA